MTERIEAALEAVTPTEPSPEPQDAACPEAGRVPGREAETVTPEDLRRALLALGWSVHELKSACWPLLHGRDPNRTQLADVTAEIKGITDAVEALRGRLEAING